MQADTMSSKSDEMELAGHYVIVKEIRTKEKRWIASACEQQSSALSFTIESEEH